MLNRLFAALLTAVLVVTSVSCRAVDGTGCLSRSERSRFRSYVSEAMIERPNEHRTEWAIARTIDWVGHAAAGMAGANGVGW